MLSENNYILQKCAYTLPRYKASKDSDKNYRKLYTSKTKQNIHTIVHKFRHIKSLFHQKEGKKEKNERKGEN
jgi:hypothetical protein